MSKKPIPKAKNITVDELITDQPSSDELTNTDLYEASFKGNQKVIKHLIEKL